ncbi:MAG: sensor domain-containing diguanylate cyclase [Actinomycetota bacterium]|nr:sensor domain-containing diguanylate cyclase [Actinomycetota bacterium]
MSHRWPDHAAFPDITTAAGSVLAQLRDEAGFSWWALTRITGDTQSVLAVGEDDFPVPVGTQLPWPDTICHQVLFEGAPRLAPDLRDASGVAALPVVRQWQVGAYAIAPLTVDGTTLFGTLCAVHHEPVPATVADRLPLVDLQARLLSTVLATDLELDQQRRRAERAEADALIDPLTGLVNRRGWQMLLDREEQRCRRYGAVASVLALDLDSLKVVNDRHGHAAGDALLRRAAQVLQEAFRSADVAARLGGDEFGVLAVETDAQGAQHERDRVQRMFDAAEVPASIGVATRRPAGGLAQAWADADAAMYAAKHARQQR